MIRRYRHIPSLHTLQALVTLWAMLMAVPSQADPGNCAGTDVTRLEHAFSSGASWELCASVNDQHGLQITALHYRAPGDSLRLVLQQAHMGQILMHYHDEPDSRAQLGDKALGRLLPMTENQCSGTGLLDEGAGALLCSRIEDNGVLAKYAQRPSLLGQSWELSSALQRDTLVWTISVTLSEDGQITPSVTLSGRAREANPDLTAAEFAAVLPQGNQLLVRATVLSTWRLVFNLDQGAFDSVQQFDFPLDPTRGNRRPMQVTTYDTERFAVVERDLFRGWRIVDDSGPGYYLDPSNSGFSYSGGQHDWTRFDVGVSRFKSCELHALNNQSNDECGQSLDDFINGESLTDAHPVIWFSQSRTFNPTSEDWPVISNFHQSFTLLPFDWTPESPFEVIE